MTNPDEEIPQFSVVTDPRAIGELGCPRVMPGLGLLPESPSMSESHSASFLRCLEFQQQSQYLVLRSRLNMELGER